MERGRECSKHFVRIVSFPETDNMIGMLSFVVFFWDGGEGIMLRNKMAGDQLSSNCVMYIFFLVDLQ